jgi:tRNA threonylcarbamoyladenosine biosynthesis protein TsaB
MLILAIECSGIAGSVALFSGEREICCQELPPQKSSVMSLSLTIRDVLAGLGDSPRTPELICVTTGPGSFTGLRVGLATAKMLAFAWNVPVVAVDSLAAIALRARKSEPPQTTSERVVFVTVMNAFRKQVFAGVWTETNAPKQILQIAATQVVDIATWIAQPLVSLVETPLPARQQVIVTGPGLEVCQPQAADNMQIAASKLWFPRASEVAELGWQGFKDGFAVSAVQLLPNYVRCSAAEEKAALPLSARVTRHSPQGE